MINLGLRRSEYDRFVRTLHTPHWIHVTVRVLDLDHNYLADVSNRLMGGQVNIDADAEVTRSARLELFDPNRSFSMLPEDPSDAAMFLDRMVSLVYSIAPPDKSEWFHVPIFCGPVRKINRNSFTVTIEAQGKDSIPATSSYATKTFKERTRKTSIIRYFLKEQVGENRLAIPDLKASTPRKVKVGGDAGGLKPLRTLARSMGYILFWDGRGTARMRPLGSKSVFEYDERYLKSSPEVGYDLDHLKNSVVVVGAKPKGAKKKIQVRVNPSRSHPLSPWSIGRTGAPRYLTETIEDDSIKTKKEAKALARKRLNDLLYEAISVAFDALVVPHLEEMDLIRINTESFGNVARLRTMTIPLTADGTANVGYLKRATPNRRSIRRRRK